MIPIKIILNSIKELENFHFGKDNFGDFYIQHLQNHEQYIEFVNSTLQKCQNNLNDILSMRNSKIQRANLQTILNKLMTYKVIQILPEHLASNSVTVEYDKNEFITRNIPESNYELSKAYEYYKEIPNKLNQILNYALDKGGFETDNNIITGPFEAGHFEKRQFKSNLSVDELAYLFLLLKESGIIDAKTKNLIGEMISENMVNINGTQISADSFANRMIPNPDVKVQKMVEDALHTLISLSMNGKPKSPLVQNFKSKKTKL